MNIKSETEVQQVIQNYGSQLYRTAYMLLGNAHDVQDVLQEVLIRYMEKAPDFRDIEHEKAWLLKVTANLCKDFLRFNRCHIYVNLEDLELTSHEPEDLDILKEVISLPPKWKAVLLLHYVEGYPLQEIAGILGISENAVKKRIQRGKEALQKHSSNTLFLHSKLIAAALMVILLVTVSSTSYAAYNVYQEKNLDVFFDLDISNDRIHDMELELQKISGVASVRFVSADEAWETFQSEYLTPELAAEFPENPLADCSSFRVSVRLDANTSAIRQSIENLDGVRLVSNLRESKAAEAH